MSILDKDGVEVTFDPSFDDYMSDAGYDPAYGARPIKRLLQRELVNKLAVAVLDGTIRKGGRVKVGMNGGQIVLVS